MMQKSDILSEVSHMRKLAHFVTKLPWPLHSREVFVQACGIILKKENALVLSMSSPPGENWMGRH
jgi:hypothetical protein